MMRFLMGLLVCVFMNSCLYSADVMNIKAFKASSGIDVRLVSDKSLPVVSLTILIDGGIIYDPISKPFLTHGVLKMLYEGTHSRSGEDLKVALLDKGIEISFGPHGSISDVVAIRLRTTKKYLKDAVLLLRDMMTNSKFESTSIKEWQERFIASFLNIRMEPDFIAEDELNRMVFAGTSFVRSYLSDDVPGKIRSINELDLRSHWDAVLRQENIRIGICGDISDSEAKGIVEDLFAGVSQRSALDKFSYDFPMKSGLKVVKTSHPQAIVKMAHPGVLRNDDDYALYIMTLHLFSGGMSSRLFNEIREKRGLVYSIGSDSSQGLSRSVLSFAFATKATQAYEALEKVKEQFTLLKEKGFTKEELDFGKSSISGMLAMAYNSTTSVASRLATSLYCDEPITFHEDIEKEINNITLDKLNIFVKKYIDLDRLQIVIVGDIPEEEKIKEVASENSKSQGESDLSTAPRDSSDQKSPSEVAGNSEQLKSRGIPNNQGNDGPKN